MGAMIPSLAACLGISHRSTERRRLSRGWTRIVTDRKWRLSGYTVADAADENPIFAADAAHCIHRRAGGDVLGGIADAECAAICGGAGGEELRGGGSDVRGS